MRGGAGDAQTLSLASAHPRVSAPRSSRAGHLQPATSALLPNHDRGRKRSLSAACGWSTAFLDISSKIRKALRRAHQPEEPSRTALGCLVRYLLMIQLPAKSQLQHSSQLQRPNDVICPRCESRASRGRQYSPQARHQNRFRPVQLSGSKSPRQPTKEKSCQSRQRTYDASLASHQR